MEGQNQGEGVELLDQLVFLHGLLDDGCFLFRTHPSSVLYNQNRLLTAG